MEVQKVDGVCALNVKQHHKSLMNAGRTHYKCALYSVPHMPAHTVHTYVNTSSLLMLYMHPLTRQRSTVESRK